VFSFGSVRDTKRCQQWRQLFSRAAIRAVTRAM
jgi:hypothetical protein